MKRLIAGLYEKAIELRAAAYSRGWLSSRRLPAPVVSIGNLTMGGTGKTPLVAYLSQALLSASWTPVVLSRGYRGTAEKSNLIVSLGKGPTCSPEECGDEPFWLAQSLPGAIVAVGQDRYQTGQLVARSVETAAALIFLLDDGFQHLQLRRDVNIVLLDATDPFGGGKLLPAGRLREPVSAIARADQVIVTRAHRPLDIEEIELAVRRYHPTVPIAYFYHDAIALIDARNGKEYPLKTWMGEAVIALSGIGNPANFILDLEHYQMKVVEEFTFRDHHSFTQGELDRALKALSSGRAEQIITTEKDAVRLRNLAFEPGQISALRIESRAEDDSEFRRGFLEDIAAIPSGKGAGSA